MKNKVGRNTKLSPEDVQKVIFDFRQNVKPNGKISYSEIYKHAEELYEKGIISASTSDNFWRKVGRLGRAEVDKANEVFSEVIAISENKTVEVANIEDLLEKEFDNKELIENEFKKLQSIINDLLKKQTKQEQILKKIENEHIELKSKLNDEKKKNEELQTVIFNLHRIASENTNSKQQKLIEVSMNSLFDHPDFEILKNEKQSAVADVVPINKKSISNKFRK